LFIVTKICGVEREGSANAVDEKLCRELVMVSELRLFCGLEGKLSVGSRERLMAAIISFLSKLFDGEGPI